MNSPAQKKSGPNWEIKFTKEAVKDSKYIERAGLRNKATKLLKKIKENPKQYPPYLGKLSLYRHARLTLQHRIVYEIHEKEKVIRVVSLWGHFVP